MTNLMRSLLFVPGNRPERFNKAAASGADIYCLDLEDAVPATEKATARALAIQHLGALPPDRASLCFVRINSLVSAEGLRDLLTLHDSGLAPDGIMLPMASASFEIRQLEQLLGRHQQLQIMLLIETATGLDNLPALLAASDRVTAIGFGAADYAAALGCEISWDAMLHARCAIIAAASGRGVHCFDSPWFAINDQDGLREEARRVAGLGFRGKLAIHPSQISVIHDSFAPTEQDLHWASEVLHAFDQSGGGVVTVNGTMVDQPVVQRAKRILALAGK